MPKNAKKITYKEQEFEMYVLWKSLPAILRGQEPRIYEQLKITDELVLQLLEIKNQTQFAKKFDVKDLATLTDWNKKIEEHDLLKNKRKEWAKRLTSNIVLALYKKALIEGDAARIKLWYQLVEDWKEGTTIEQKQKLIILDC